MPTKGSLKMRTRLEVWLLTLIATAAFAPILRAQTTTAPAGAKVQATAHDLSGLWIRPRQSKHIDPARRFEAQQPAMTPWAEAKFKATRNIYSEKSAKSELNKVSGGDPTFSCFPPGVPGIYFHVAGDGRPMEILNAPGRTLEFFEYDHYVRQVWIDGRDHPKDLASTWMGDSIGKWEGDTFVIDSVGFNDKSVLDPIGHPHSDELHVVERIRRLDHDTLEDNVAITDPKAYAKPWGGQLVFVLAPSDWTVMEDICEDNVNFIDFITKANGDSK
jgi:hypothetical protein